MNTNHSPKYSTNHPPDGFLKHVLGITPLISNLTLDPMQEKCIHWTIIKKKHSGRSFPKTWPKDIFVRLLPPGQLPSSSSIRRMGNYAPAKIIDALTNKLSRISILYRSSQN